MFLVKNNQKLIGLKSQVPLTSKISQRNFSFYQATNYDPGYAERLKNQQMVRSQKQLRFAIIGSGPAGFYMAKMLLQAVKDCRVDIFDRNPHPYGLIRTGVSPDHQAMKRITNDFNQVFDQNPDRVKFFGNVWVGDIDQNRQDFELSKKHEQDGKTVQVSDLQKRYSAVVLAYGAINDRKLGIEHEDTATGILPSRRVVNWYNGSLDDDLNMETELNLKNSRDVTIIGNGNIMCDIVRMMHKDPSEFEMTDMSKVVIDRLRQSQVKNIQAVARRGVTQTAFSLKEIREVCAIPGLEFYMMKDEVRRSMTDSSEQELASTYARLVERRTKFLFQHFRAIQNENHYQDVLNNGKKKLILRLLQSPSKFILDDAGKNVSAVEFKPQQLQGKMNEQTCFTDETLDPIQIKSDIVIKSIGYASTPMTGVPFNEKTQTIPHEFGCVVKGPGSKEVIPGLYVCGWAKRGPNGIIDATLRDTKESFGIIRHHIETGSLPEMSTSVEEIEKLLQPRSRFVTYQDWQGIDKIEKEEGEKTLSGKIREKILDRDHMLKLVKQNN